MPAVEVTRQARDELRTLIETRDMYIESEDRVVVIAFHDARTSEAATART